MLDYLPHDDFRTPSTALLNATVFILLRETSRAMELVNNDFSHRFVASIIRSERNGSIQMVEVAFVVVYTIPAMFSAVFVHCKASSHL